MQNTTSIKTILFGIFFLASLLLSAQIKTITPLYADNHQVLLNGTWKFKYISGMTSGSDSLFFNNNFNVSHWGDIKVPGHWDLQGFDKPTYGMAPAGLGLYRTTFTVPDSYKGQQVFMKFEGVLYGYDLYVNGKWVDYWDSAFHAVSFNITDFVEYGKENSLALRVTTRPKAHEFDRCDNWALAGIFRDVSIFSVPDTYIDDYVVTTHLNGDQSAKVKIMTDVKNSKSVLPDNMILLSLLYSPEGELIERSETKVRTKKNALELNVKNPKLWSAETPALYTLKLQLLKGGVKSQEISQKVGIREITIDGEVLKLNNKPLKLRGVNHHDLDPVTGKYVNEEQILKDLLLMKKANINFIRSCHNPPSRRKLELCDSLGIYVSDEMPYAFGFQHMHDPSFGDVMMKRADATVMRDKNHPCIIMWTIGNENSIVRHTIRAGRYVKEMDPTRPISYAGTGDLASIPDFADIYAPHYPNVKWIDDYKGDAKRPVIFTEYAHALGLSFGSQSDLWQRIFNNKALAGGAVWHFHDQGILLKADKPVDTNKLTYDVWADSVTYYCATLEGADGVVYADRTPQVDYWQLRKVYSPVQIIENELTVSAGDQELNFKAYNQFDFTDLNALKGEWKLYKNREVYKQGKLTIDCAPHDTVDVALSVVLPEGVGEDVWLLKFAFSDKDKMELYEHTISLTTPQKFSKLKDILNRNLTANNLKIKKNGKTSSTVSGNNFVYDMQDKSFTLSLSAQGKTIPVITDGVLARAGREPIMADVTCRDRYFPDDSVYFWNPFVLKASEVTKKITQENGDGYSFTSRNVFPRQGELFVYETIEGDIDYAINKTGEMKIDFDLKPVDVTGFFLNAGVSLILAPEINNFIWLGDGPYVSTPDKHTLNDFGIHQIKKGDLYFNGNRHNVEMLALTDDEGNGIAILCDKADIAVELKNGQIVVSYNSLVSGVGNKKTMPAVLHRAGKVEEIKGAFSIIPLSAGNWPQKIKEVLGYPDKYVEVFNPFYYSLDSSK